MASGHVNRIKRPDTWLHRPMLRNVKKVLANPEPSTHDPKRTSRLISVGDPLGSFLTHRPVRGCFPRRASKPFRCSPMFGGGRATQKQVPHRGVLSRSYLQRRDFITLFSAAAVSWPVAVCAEQPVKLATIGYMGPNTPSVDSYRLPAFVKRLSELGWIEGRTVAIEYRWAEGRSEHLAEIAAEFVQRKGDVIVTAGPPPTAAAEEATSTIPIVFAAVGDPVGTGMVASLARPGGNVTGMSLQQTDSAGKRLELLREVIPGLRHLAIMANGGNPTAVLDMREAQAVARTIGLETVAS